MAYTYDRADQAIQQTIGGVDTAFAYNAWGDLTAAADRDHGVTTHAYDAGGRMVSLTPPGATPATYTYDALGRPATRSIASASLTYAYIGTTARSYATIPSSGAGSATYALIDADASRLALDTGGTTAWTTFDLHGDLAATTASGSATIVSALRSDAYGASLDTYTAGSGATAVPWRYQDRLDLSPDPDEPLYDAGARRYRPSLGAFTALDTYAGSALNPLSLNRYLYAHANPTSLIDPSGHCVTCPPMLDGAYTLPTQGANAPVSAAAAQSQVAAAASWAPASATSGQPAGSMVVPGPAVPGPAVTSVPAAWVYRPRPTDPYAYDPVYEELIAGGLPRSALNTIWDWSGGQLVGVVQGALGSSLEFGAAAGEWAWNSTGALAFDSGTFVDQWATTLVVGQRIVGNPFGTFNAVVGSAVQRTVDLTLAGQPGRAAGELGLLGLAGGIRSGLAHGVDDAIEAAARNSQPAFIATVSGEVIVVPQGAVGPLAARSGGFQFIGGSGGHGLNHRVTGVRIMDPTARYPNGYVVYMNRNGQTVNPMTGRTISRSDPWAHLRRR